ncbi:DUF397 domain-containing protein [Actinomadura nitritigenes]|uniref:DUF397 domain-containing protein n=1 Tax=Actinomadura nitritigenes TaxID=134602 RepID=UPI003D8B8FF7
MSLRNQRVTGAELIDVQWRKSSRSGNGGNCVEVATHDQAHLARDSKDPNGPVLAFDRRTWGSFLDQVKTGRFDLA